MWSLKGTRIFTLTFYEFSITILQIKILGLHVVSVTLHVWFKISVEHSAYMSS